MGFVSILSLAAAPKFATFSLSTPLLTPYRIDGIRRLHGLTLGLGNL
jgi:hypothetical protein